ncbi:histidine kinase dimerization/phosphoacceptor domain -containing protein [Virgifigura deserti]|uniref:histidine kinase dimerization/phosphoacceptor domain -containing protein n=1 Tax=Virgifigura deserti TaxID=2268457 RepID=UPI003CCBD153
MNLPAAPRVLYIDDDPGIARLVAKGLARHGVSVDVAHNGRDGTAKAAAGGFDVIGLDHFMPEQDGLTTLAALKSLPDCPPIIYVTGSEDLKIAVAALKAGAEDFVIKDVQGQFLDLLRNAIEAAMQQLRLRRAKEEAEQEVRRAKERLEALATKQAVLLREVNHRVANSLQLIASLIRLQTSVTKDPDAKQALLQASERVFAVSQVHQRLYTSDDVRFVEMDQYLESLIADLRRTSDGKGDQLVLSADDVRLVPDRAIAVGVIVTELITNAFKYAYPNGAGPIRVHIRRLDFRLLSLVVEDDGVGQAASETAALGTGIGRQIVDGMAASLDSKVELDPTHPGTRFTMTFAEAAPSGTTAKCVDPETESLPL